MGNGNFLADLLDKAKDGRLAQHELDQVVAALRESSAAGPATYTRLYIVGRAEGREYEDLVRGFLERPDDPMLSKLALQILCGFWDLTEKYLPEVKRFLAGVDWDVDWDVRVIAISEAGEYLREHDDPDLATTLLHMVDDPAEDELMRELAVDALARALGDSYQSMPEAADRTPLSAPWSQDVIDRAYQRYLSN